MDTKRLEAFAKKAAISIKSESDLKDFQQMLSKVAIETARIQSLRNIWGTRNTPGIPLISVVTVS